MDVSTYLAMPIVETTQVGEARRRATRLAESRGFGETAVGQIAIAATELGNNLVKHTHAGGTLFVQVGFEGCIELICVNRGGGTNNTSVWMRDGFSTAGTMGTGLGAVSRLAQEFDIYSDVEHGTTVVARFYEKPVESLFDVGIIAVPKENEPVCGDTCAVVEEGRRISAMVADGLGHGIEAAEASREAARLFRQIPFGEPAEILRVMHGELRKTRGAAVSILQIEPHHRKARFSGVGNVSALVADSENRRHFVPDNGTVGYELRKVRNTEIEWSPTDIVVMHSDGFSASWNLDEYPLLTRHLASTIAATLFRDFSKRHDDATVIVIKARH